MPPDSAPTATDAPDRRLARNVWVVGVTSMLTDVSSEMIYPLLAPFLVLTLGATPAIVGIVEGVAESTAALLKVFSGWFSDRIGRRKPVTWAGYALSSIGKLLLFLAGAWATVLFARFLERVGKGIRTAPRDALISESVPKERRGYAFGVRTALDFLGGVIGVGLAWLLASRFLSDGGIVDIDGLRTVFGWAVLPAGLALLAPALLREPPRPATASPVHAVAPGAELSLPVASTQGLPGASTLPLPSGPVRPDAAGSTHASPAGSRPLPSLSPRGFSPSLKAFLIAAVVFNIGNSSNQFLLLRSKDLLEAGGLTPLRALLTSILCYCLFKAVVTVLGLPLGALSDRLGRKRLVVWGYVLYAAVYLLFAVNATPSSIWVLWALYGIYAALTDGMEKAMVSDLSPPEIRATALGFHGTAVGIALLPASVVAGWLYERSTAAPFLLGAALAAAATVIVVVGVRGEGRR